MYNQALQHHANSQPRTATHNSKHVDAGHQPDILPTPPNSISPSLPPHRIASPSLTSTRTLVGTESDGDSENEDKKYSSSWSRTHLSEPITSESLATHFLPEIFRRENGAVSGSVNVKDILSHLRTLPNFKSLDNQTARRKVTAALEHHIGGVEKNVMYNKVKWGVWEAIPMDSKDKGRRASKKEARRPSSISVPRVKASGSSIESPLSVRSNAVDSDSENEADAMSLDGDAPRPKLLKGQRHFTPEPLVDDSEATEDEDWDGTNPDRYREASMSSYAASHSSRRGSHVSGTSGIDIVRARDAPHHRHHGSAPKQRYLSLPNGTLISSDFIRSLTYQGGIRPFEKTYSRSLKHAAKEERRQKKHRHPHAHGSLSRSQEHRHTSMTFPKLSRAEQTERNSVRSASIACPAEAPIQEQSEMEAAKALLALQALS